MLLPLSKGSLPQTGTKENKNQPVRNIRTKNKINSQHMHLLYTVHIHVQNLK